jgi:hypothetical protein
MRAVVAGVLAIGLAATGCTSTLRPGPAVVHVRAVLQSTRFDPYRHHSHTLRSPMTGTHVIATDTAGKHVTAKVDQAGNATLRLAPGRYVLTSSEHDSCYPKNIAVQAGRTQTVALPCVAP